MPKRKTIEAPLKSKMVVLLQQRNLNTSQAIAALSAEDIAELLKQALYLGLFGVTTPVANRILQLPDGATEEQRRALLPACTVRLMQRVTQVHEKAMQEAAHEHGSIHLTARIASLEALAHVISIQEYSGWGAFLLLQDYDATPPTAANAPLAN